MRPRLAGRQNQVLALLLALFMLAAPGSSAPAQVMSAAWLLPVAPMPQQVSLPAPATPMSCDPRTAWRDHYEYVSCVAREALAGVAAGSLTLAQGQALIRRAAATPLDRGGHLLLTRSRP